jgi:replicative DNA helicase
LARNTQNILNYARIVANRAALRELATTAETILAATSNPDGRTPSEIVAEAENALNGLAADRHSSEATTAAAEICALLRQADDGARHGLELGIADLDGLTGGLEPGQLFDIAARPAVGKTAFALAIADRVASNGGRVAFFSLEMSRSEIAARLLSAAARVNGRSLRTGPNPSEWQRLADAATAPGLENLIIDDKPAASVAYIRARCRRLKRQGGLALVVVDYLQLMTPADTRANRSEQVGSLSRGLKSLAKELHVPIIALAQLNRQSEARADRRPQLSDLRDSGEIEQDADLVLLLHKAGEGVIECSLAKHRNGPTGVFWLDFAPETMTFSRRYGGPPKTEKPARGGFQND